MCKNSPAVVIVDYGMGNLFSIERVINYLGGIPIISSKPSIISRAKRVILPGVGAFGDGMENLRKRGLIEPIKKFVHSGKLLLGICLGMQLFMSESEEFGLHLGLDLVRGRVKRLSEPQPKGSFCKIPHVGWNRLHSPAFTKGPKDSISFRSNNFFSGGILENIPEGAFVYFVHSYAVFPDTTSVILAETAYGNNRFCSVLQQYNLFGCQFHPEVSGGVGLRIIKNFIFGF